MGFLNKKQEGNSIKEKKGLRLNELNDDELLNVAGGRDYSSEAEKIANVNLVSSIVNKLS